MVLVGTSTMQDSTYIGVSGAMIQSEAEHLHVKTIYHSGNTIHHPGKTIQSKQYSSFYKTISNVACVVIFFWDGTCKQ